MRTLQKIEPSHAQLIPPAGCVSAGITPDGKPLYRQRRRMSRSVPKFEPHEEARLRAALSDEDLATVHDNEDLLKVALARGLKPEQAQRKHPVTGEPLLPLREPVLYDDERTFYLESQGNWNVGLVEYTPPTPEQLAAQERARKIEEMKQKMAEAMVDADVTPERLTSLLRQPSPVTVSADEPGLSEVVESPATYPHMYGPGLWKLSNGESFRGKKSEAVEAEDAVHEAQAAAEVTSEY